MDKHSLFAFGYYGSGYSLCSAMKIDLGNMVIKVNLISLYRLYRKIKRLIKKWRGNVLEEETAGDNKQ